MKAALFGLAALALSGCVTAPRPAPAPQVSASLARALDTRPDGYRAVLPSNQRFEIVSTSASRSRLCRVVSIERPQKFDVRTYCKVKGGRWS